jgi:hypothetical protein
MEKGSQRMVNSIEMREMTSSEAPGSCQRAIRVVKNDLLLGVSIVWLPPAPRLRRLSKKSSTYLSGYAPAFVATTARP